MFDTVFAMSYKDEKLLIKTQTFKAINIFLFNFFSSSDFNALVEILKCKKNILSIFK